MKTRDFVLATAILTALTVVLFLLVAKVTAGLEPWKFLLVEAVVIGLYVITGTVNLVIFLKKRKK